MAREARKKSRTGIYFIHINWKENFKPFKDRNDYNFAINYLYISSLKYSCDIFAYSFDNLCARFIIQENIYENCPKFIQSFLSSFSSEINKKYQRRGGITKDRYISIPIEESSSLLQAVLFIHNTSSCHEHSSADEYVSNKTNGICERQKFFSIIGLSNKEFEEAKENLYSLPKEFIKTCKRDNAYLKKLIKDNFGIQANQIKNLEKNKRDKILKDLRLKYYLTIKEIQAITGISGGIIAAAGNTPKKKSPVKQDEIWLL